MNNFLLENLLEDLLEEINNTNFIEPMNTILNSSLYDTNPIKHVINNDVKNSLIPIKFKEANDKENNDKCCISYEVFKDDDDIIQLPCNHCFFVEPIMKWLTEDSCECPVCRYKFDSIEKKIEVPEVEIAEIENSYLDSYYINNPHNLLFSQMVHSIFSDNAYFSIETPPMTPRQTPSPTNSQFDIDIDID